MILYHTTPRKNLEAIRRLGINPAISQGKAPRVWLHTRTKAAWAYLHISKHHRTTDLVTFEVQVSRSFLTRHRRGIWTTSDLVDKIGNVHTTYNLLKKEI